MDVHPRFFAREEKRIETLTRGISLGSAQDWPLRLPWDCGSKFIQPQSGCVISSRNEKRSQPPCGWDSTKLVPRVAETANPGLKGATALRFAERVDSSRT